MPGYFDPVVATHLAYGGILYTAPQLMAGGNPLGNLASYTPTLDGSLGGITVSAVTPTCSRVAMTGPDAVKYVYCEGTIDFTLTGGPGTGPLKLSLPPGFGVAGGGTEGGKTVGGPPPPCGWERLLSPRFVFRRLIPARSCRSVAGP